MRKKTSRVIHMLCFIVEMIVFCSLWVLVFRSPFIKNLFYAIAVFIGGKLVSWAGASIGAALGNPDTAVGGYIVGHKISSVTSSTGIVGKVAKWISKFL
jgi:hypothetical protein